VTRRLVQRAGGRGQDLIEFALILPLLLLLLTGIMEFALAVMAYNTVANAAREGARYGIVRVNTPADCAAQAGAIEEAARRLTVGLDQDRLDFAVSCPRSPTTGRLQVQVEAEYVHQFITAPLIMALGGDGTLPMYTVSTMYVE
jgi:Flp pilus assembly protein TadG